MNALNQIKDFKNWELDKENKKYTFKIHIGYEEAHIFEIFPEIDLVDGCNCLAIKNIVKIDGEEFYASTNLEKCLKASSDKLEELIKCQKNIMNLNDWDQDGNVYSWCLNENDGIFLRILTTTESVKFSKVATELSFLTYDLLICGMRISSSPKLETELSNAKDIADLYKASQKG